MLDSPSPARLIPKVTIIAGAIVHSLSLLLATISAGSQRGHLLAMPFTTLLLPPFSPVAFHHHCCQTTGKVRARKRIDGNFSFFAFPMNCWIEVKGWRRCRHLDGGRRKSRLVFGFEKLELSSVIGDVDAKERRGHVRNAEWRATRQTSPRCHKHFLPDGRSCALSAPTDTLADNGQVLLAKV